VVGHHSFLIKSIVVAYVREQFIQILSPSVTNFNVPNTHTIVISAEIDNIAMQVHLYLRHHIVLIYH